MSPFMMALFLLTAVIDYDDDQYGSTRAVHFGPFTLTDYASNVLEWNYVALSIGDHELWRIDRQEVYDDSGRVETTLIVH